jgi:thiol:disulfide interchange protein
MRPFVRLRVLLLTAMSLSALSLLAGCSQNTGSAGAAPDVVQPPVLSAPQRSSQRPTVRLQPNSKKQPDSHHPTKAASPKNVKPKAIRWHTDWNAAFKEAKARQKPVMVDFYADWCGACHYLDESIYSAPAVIEQSRNFVCVKVNTDQQPDIARQYVGQGLPTIAFLDAQGNILTRQEGAPREPELFVQWMQEARAKTTGTPA